jgi:hypothetical protein
MMRRGGVALALLAAMAVAGCGDDGGELREATERRRADGVVEEPPPRTDGDAAAEQPPERLPAFVLDEPPAATPADTPESPRPPAQDAAAWTAGTVDVVRTQRGAATLLDLRTGANAGFDRVVLEFTGSTIPGYRVEYVDRPVRECGSGRTVAVAGDGWLAITLRGTQAHTDDGRSTVQRRNRRLDMAVIRQVVFTCDFEGIVQVVLGVGSPNRYRVTELSDPARLIVDLQQ